MFLGVQLTVCWCIYLPHDLDELKQFSPHRFDTTIDVKHLPLITVHPSWNVKWCAHSNMHPIPQLGNEWANLDNISWENWVILYFYWSQNLYVILERESLWFCFVSLLLWFVKWDIHLLLIHWAQVVYINRTIINSDHGWSPVGCQAIIRTRTNAGLLSIGPLRANIGKIWIKHNDFHSRRCMAHFFSQPKYVNTLWHSDNICIIWHGMIMHHWFSYRQKSLPPMITYYWLES